MRTLTIGNVKLENSYILGPMAGVTDLPFRLLCKRTGRGTSVHGNGQRKRDPLSQSKYRKSS